MRLEELRKHLAEGVFAVADVKKYFPKEDEVLVRTQLYRWKKRGLLESPKRGLYSFDLARVSELELADQLYKGSSYVSLESALHWFGIIPDVVQETTSVVAGQPKKFRTKVGVFGYHKISKQLFWGYRTEGGGKIAMKEKALLDYFYIRKIKTVADLRLKLEGFDKDLYTKFSKFYPKWVRRIEI